MNRSRITVQYITGHAFYIVRICKCIVFMLGYIWLVVGFFF